MTYFYISLVQEGKFLEFDNDNLDLVSFLKVMNSGDAFFAISHNGESTVLNKTHIMSVVVKGAKP